MSTFRDAIAQAISNEQSMMMGATPDMDLPKFNAGDAQCAWGVLAMPEMEAIRQQLALMAHSLATGCNDDVNHGRAGRPVKPYEETLRWWLSDHLPDDVIAWVLGGDQ